jgi:acylphosphatase
LPERIRPVNNQAVKNVERITVRFELRGRVQGVGCRAQVQKRVTVLAKELQEPIAGWVRNLPGGEVEVVVQASRVGIERVEVLLATGLNFPVRVDFVARASFETAEIADEFRIFQIRRGPGPRRP